MKPYEALTERGQLLRLRQLAEVALSHYQLAETDLTALTQAENTLFRIDSNRGRFVLRISPTGHQTEAEIYSEAMWLSAICRDTGLVVPEPVPNQAGKLISTVGVEGVPEPRHCVLLRWVEGQFYRKRLSPIALERVGRFTAQLHEHAVNYEPPVRFTRHNVQWGSEDEPGEMERVLDRGLAQGAAIIDPHDLATFTLARHYLREQMAEVGNDPYHFGLIHADLHHANFLFHESEVRAIGFDNCGWGHYLYDLAVTQWYLQARPDFAALCEAHLRGYQQVRPLPDETFIPMFRAARTLLMAAYMVGQPDNPALQKRAPKFVERCAAVLREYLAQQGPNIV